MVYSPGSSMQKHVTDLRGLQHKLLLMGSRVDEILGRILLTSEKELFPTTVEILLNRLRLSPKFPTGCAAARGTLMTYRLPWFR
ncbi:hypothetical protein B5M09_013508 [Aphanomyces astaci]|uniref:Uncharacterized protein n=1 Tax=Aphanomyces astaci TaxID=112090 RepID=A0A3R7YJ79_APHAT|nr:hypothetical protein B5M09_013508 [Aphanomyces astaci]